MNRELTSHSEGIHEQRGALALLQVLPGGWGADVSLLHITDKHVIWLQGATHTQKTYLQKLSN